MYLMIDNYDSFVYNLVAYMQELHMQVEVVRNDQVTVDYVEELYQKKRLCGIIISPGPKRPEDGCISLAIVRHFGQRVPILGVCLGHQIIAYELGGSVTKGVMPMHGKVSNIYHNQSGVFQGIPSPYGVTRYHSLVVEQENLPDCLQVDARDENGVIMGISHKYHPVFGIQFHPEAVLTEYGLQTLDNYKKICERWWKNGPHSS